MLTRENEQARAVLVQDALGLVLVLPLVVIVLLCGPKRQMSRDTSSGTRSIECQHSAAKA
jgi:hypothetical protein